MIIHYRLITTVHVVQDCIGELSLFAFCTCVLLCYLLPRFVSFVSNVSRENEFSSWIFVFSLCDIVVPCVLFRGNRVGRTQVGWRQTFGSLQEWDRSLRLRLRSLCLHSSLASQLLPSSKWLRLWVTSLILFSWRFQHHCTVPSYVTTWTIHGLWSVKNLPIWYTCTCTWWTVS